MTEGTSEGKVISIDEAKADPSMADEYRKVNQVYMKEYDGPVVVDFVNGLTMGGEPQPRMIQAVKQLLEQKVEVKIATTVDVEEREVTAFLDEHFPNVALGTDIEVVEAFDDTAEHWSTKAVQFNGEGLRVDGANVNGASIQIQVQVDERGISVFVGEPKITLVHEQVVSLGMFLSQTITQAMEAMNSAGQDSLKVSPDELKDGANIPTPPAGQGQDAVPHVEKGDAAE